MLNLKAFDQLLPAEVCASAEWMERNLIMPKGTETAGQPFSLDAYPHVRGVCDAFDDPTIRRIALQWGTRTGKTTTCLGLMAKQAGVDPRNMMFASTSKDSAGRVTRTRLYPLLESCQVTAEQLPAKGKRGRFLVELALCSIFVGWSGSVSSLADVGARFAIANEIDKWDRAQSIEADPLELFLERVKGFLDHKVIVESTPTVAGQSRIEREMALANQHLRWCPCPRCGEYQVLVKGSGTGGGIVWDRLRSGKSDPQLAEDTAYYRCGACEGRIDNGDRLLMLRAGVWAPVGCHVTPAGEIAGTPRSQVRDRVGFGPLPRWYATTERWGDFARRWVEAKGKPAKLRGVVNSDMAELWQVVQQVETWETIAARLIVVGRRPATVPEGFSLVTVGVDRQQTHYVYLVKAWAKGRRSSVIEYGTRETWAEVLEEILKRAWQHADGGPAVKLSRALADARYKPVEEHGQGVYRLCRDARQRGVSVFPALGSSSPLGVPFREAVTDRKSVMPGQRVVHMDTLHSQEWLEQQLRHYKPEDAGGCGLFDAEQIEHQDLVMQWCNDAAMERLDATGHATIVWERIDTDVPVDLRDAARLADTAFLHFVRNGDAPVRVVAAEVAQQPPREERRGGLRTPDGRPFSVLDR